VDRERNTFEMRTGNSRSWSRSTESRLIIRSTRDVESLLDAGRDRRRLTVLIHISGLPPEKSLEWELKLNSLLHECGCSLGAKFVIFALAVSILWQCFQSNWAIMHWPGFLVRTLAAAFVAGGIGKLIGIAFARVRMKKVAGQILRFTESLSTGGIDDVDMHKVGG
jgi:hypothetical protein